MSEKKVIAVVGATGAQGGGLVRAIHSDGGGPFVARAVTRKLDSEKAQALAQLGVEVVAGDADDPPSLDRAFAGAYGAFCVTNFWEHFSAEREGAQATAMARATRNAGVQHVIWSTLEDTRKTVPLDDSRLPTLHGKYKVPHFDSKGAVDRVFAEEAAPTTYLLAAFYWENFLNSGMGPRKGPDGDLVLALPLGGVKLPGIAAEDIGKCAYGLFRRGTGTVGQRFGVAGEVLSGPEMAAKMGAGPRTQSRVQRRAVRCLPRPWLPRCGRSRQHVSVPSNSWRRVPPQPRPRAFTLAEPGTAFVRRLARRQHRSHGDRVTSSLGAFKAVRLRRTF